MFPPSRLRRELSVVVLLCTLGMFLFPGATGPYSAVHGPVTALLALRQAVKAFWSIVCAALKRAPRPQAFFVLVQGSQLSAPLAALVPRHSGTVLRC
jgi:hypothetical protein